ncbi:hypothetical protein DIPPA_22345 [Diplonema papillatum]|nr:hypothetical protein DIPPA_31975 [Diplonema papillatum]KAJ9448898.1 hypothetical protein DIPPA_22345 [Diplonema papillatum]|eukprot:gene11132-17113_t
MMLRVPLHCAARQCSTSATGGTDWKRKGLPSVAEVQWRAQYGAGVHGRLKGVPVDRAQHASLDDQQRYLDTAEALSTHSSRLNTPGDARKARRFKDWREEMKAQMSATAAKNSGSEWVDDTKTLSKLSNLKRSKMTVVTRELVESFPLVNLRKQGVADLFKALEGKDLAFSSDVVHVANPSCCVLPNTSGIHRGKVRDILQQKSYGDSAAWYTEREKTVFIMADCNNAGNNWAVNGPDVTFILGANLVSGLFRNVSQGCTGDGQPPANLKFVRSEMPAYMFFDDAVPDESIDEFILPFPSTYAAADMAHKRLPHSDFLQLVHAKLKVGGIVRVTTHNPRYHEWVRVQFLKCICPWESVPNPDPRLSPVVSKVEDTIQQGDALQPWFGARDHVVLAQEWRKPEQTPERVMDVNAKYSFLRRNQPELA